MYHYCFKCRLNTRVYGNIRFMVEGQRYLREECVAIHDALCHSPDIIISSASIELKN